jgi:hypothetical protein
VGKLARGSYAKAQENEVIKNGFQSSSVQRSAALPLFCHFGIVSCPAGFEAIWALIAIDDQSITYGMDMDLAQQLHKETGKIVGLSTVRRFHGMCQAEWR